MSNINHIEIKDLTENEVLPQEKRPDLETFTQNHYSDGIYQHL